MGREQKLPTRSRRQFRLLRITRKGQKKMRIKNAYAITHEEEFPNVFDFYENDRDTEDLVMEYLES